ncbi:MAG: hypothetical protein KDA57_22590 [Planctomycetales bacterium]|nr:hypothetical protein [Planctomycetales bacterium]
MSTHREDVEICIDLNAGRGEGYSVEIRGAVEDLRNLGLTLDQAVGMRFTFNGGADSNEAGEPADIMFKGEIVKDERWGYLAIPYEVGIFWRAT